VTQLHALQRIKPQWDPRNVFRHALSTRGLMAAFCAGDAAVLRREIVA
jgi:hypothetical protein